MIRTTAKKSFGNKKLKNLKKYSKNTLQTNSFYSVESPFSLVLVAYVIHIKREYRSFSLSRNKKINRKPSSGKSQEFVML